MTSTPDGGSGGPVSLTGTLGNFLGPKPNTNDFISDVFPQIRGHFFSVLLSYMVP